MRTVGWNVLVFVFASLASGQVLKDCSAPDKYPHTRLSTKYTTRQKFSHNEKVYYRCDENSTAFDGSPAVQCNDGQWTKLTLKCEKASCGNAGDLPNGEFHYEGNSYFGEKVYAVCNKGYTLKGTNYMICTKSGWTGEFPSCEEGEATCSTPAVANSVQVVGDVSVYRVGDNMTFTCSQGFKLDGAEQITCGPRGQWQPQPPLCLPSPDDKIPPSPGTCGAPPAISNSNAHLADRFITKTSFSSGEKAYYMCDIGYAPVGGSKSRFCKNGRWTPLKLRCGRKLCGSAGEILNGQFVYTGAEFGDTATAICNEGYNLVGQETRHCMSNGWSGRNPVCEGEAEWRTSLGACWPSRISRHAKAIVILTAVVCEDPPEVTNAERIGLQEEPYTYKSAIQYRCQVGTLIGEKHIWCTEHGIWSAPAPECKEITCPSPKVSYANWMGAHIQMFQYRSTLSIRCKVGYVMSGPSIITCERDGRWVPKLPKCQRRNRYANQWG